jgi:hypothetical protein
VKLSQYETAVAELEAGQYPAYFDAYEDEALQQAARFLRDEIAGCLWQSDYQQQAADLVARCEAICRTANV